MTKREVAEKLKSARFKSGLTQKQVAEYLGKSAKLVGHWETGYSQPDADTLSSLLKLYKIDANSFFEITTPATQQQYLTDDQQELLLYYQQSSPDGRDLIRTFATYTAHAARTGYYDPRIPAAERVLHDLRQQSGSLGETQAVDELQQN